MRFTDNAILLSVTKYSESTAICRLFAREHGLISGAVRGAMSRKHKGNYQAGNHFQVEWSARLAEHLGSLKCEVTSSISAYFLNDELRLAGLNSLLTLTQASLAEHDPHPRLFDALAALLEKMKQQDESWLADYARYELLLLEECGFRLELTRCAVTGETENLAYVSPKSGGAVTAKTGEAYKDKLLTLPSFLITPRPNGERATKLPCDSRVSAVGEGGYAPKLPEHLYKLAKNLRKNQTDAEQAMWYFLRNRQFLDLKFRRQHPVEGYIADFANTDERIIIELDGGQHNTDEGKEKDNLRSQTLNAAGWRVLRYWNNDVLNETQSVLEDLYNQLSPSPQPSPHRGEGAIKTPRPNGERVTQLPCDSRVSAVGEGGDEIVQALTLTGYFLEHRLFASHSKPLPQSRTRFANKLNKLLQSSVEAAKTSETSKLVVLARSQG